MSNSDRASGLTKHQLICRSARACRRGVSSGKDEIVFSEAHSYHRSQECRTRDRSFAARELEVLALSGRGRTTREIAAVLQLSIATVGTYRARIKEKMKFRNTEEFHHFATRWVLQRKWRVCVMNAPLR